MGVFKCGGAHFQRDCNASKNTSKHSSGKGTQSKGETTKTGISRLENWKSETSSETQGSALMGHMFVPLTRRGFKSRENKGKSKGTKSSNQGAKDVHKGKTS